MRPALQWAALALSALLCAPAVAQIHKCTGADGRSVYSDRPCAADRRDSVVKGSAPSLPAAASAAAPRAAGSGRFGLTFAAPRGVAADGSAATLACQGEPAPRDRARDGACDPYIGDTMCRDSLPVACFKATGARPPAGLADGSGWTGGQLGATDAVAGSDLGSPQAANARCEAALGAGWRMAEFHDGGGWTLRGVRGPGLHTGNRHWMRISDQPANCWDAPPAAERAPLRRQ